ncbi:MAG: hypothetical protein FWG67_03105 [Defluviitaleaceae bacterium]|nr:hypothetical protein [Defluviitaleaceae bacterium]
MFKKKRIILKLATFLIAYVTIVPSLGSGLFIAGEPKLPQTLKNKS